MAIVASLLWPAPAADAAFPGENGKIAFVSTRDGNSEIYAMNPDGSSQTRLTTNSAGDSQPTWSPDGTKVAFVSNRDGNVEIYVMNADGSSQTRLTINTTSDTYPTWSPDGSKIAFQAFSAGKYEIRVVNADGTGEAPVYVPPRETLYGISWSPSGAKIAFAESTCDPEAEDCAGDIYTINPAGTGRFDVTNTPGFVHDELPEWSPDGGTIAWFWNFEGIGLIDPDGSNPRSLPGSGNFLDTDPAWSPDGRWIAVSNELASSDVSIIRVSDGFRQTLTSDPAFDGFPSWQPIVRGHARPQGAAAFRVPLALAYEECGDDETPNRSHGPSLSFPACNPAVQSSDHLTVGTNDANGKTARSVSWVQLNVCPNGTTASGACSTPAGMSGSDIRLEASSSDVRNKSDLSDYTGELGVELRIRITDKNNSPAPPSGTSGTVIDLPFPFAVPCAATPGPDDLGASCSVVTSANSVVPNSVIGGKRAIWELGQVELQDGGPDGEAETEDNTIFARQGIFVP